MQPEANVNQIFIMAGGQFLVVAIASEPCDAAARFQ